MVLPSSGSLNFWQIDSEFAGRGYSLSSYLGTPWYDMSGNSGVLPSGPLSFSDFYSKRGSALTIVTIILTSGSSWTVPANWNNSYNFVHCIGAGGGARRLLNGLNSGGGGGAWSMTPNISLTPGASIPISIGAGGASGNPGSAGGDTSFNSGQVLAKGGSGGSGGTGGDGGQAASGVGTYKYSGGKGGSATINNRPPGGGGCAGPNGDGGTGGASNGSYGGGGGGANGGYAGAPNQGGNNRLNTGGGSGTGVAGSNGGGGGPGGLGSSELLWTDNSGGANNGLSVGPTAGSGGSGTGVSGYPAGYGAGCFANANSAAASGLPGLIVIQYGY